MKRAASDPEWSVESRHCGTVTSNDVPRLMKKLLREEFPSKIATRLSQPNEVLKLYAKGEQKMGRTVGARFVAFLDERAEAAKKEKAVPAATETTQRSEETQQETSPDIVPQHQEEVKDVPVKKTYAKPVIRLESADEELSALRAELRNAEEALEKEQKESAARLIKLEEAQSGLEEKTLEAADLRAKLKTRTDETIDLRAQINELKGQNEDLRTSLAEISQEAERLRTENDAMSARLLSVGNAADEAERGNEVLQCRIAQLEADNAGCGPARVEELETRIEKMERQHVDDLELIRDMCRNLLDWRGDE